MSNPPTVLEINLEFLWAILRIALLIGFGFILGRRSLRGKIQNARSQQNLLNNKIQQTEQALWVAQGKLSERHSASYWFSIFIVIIFIVIIFAVVMQL